MIKVEYLVFGSNYSKRTFRRKDAILISKDIDIALEEFNRINNIHEYMYSFIIADYSNTDNKKKRIYYNDKKLDFFIIGEYNEDKSDDPKHTILKDDIYIKSNGFIQLFKNNLAAARKIEYFIENRIACEATIKYQFVRFNQVCINESRIVSVTDSIYAPKLIDKNHIKYTLEPLMWNNVKKEFKII